MNSKQMNCAKKIFEEQLPKYTYLDKYHFFRREVYKQCINPSAFFDYVNCVSKNCTNLSNMDEYRCKKKCEQKFMLQ